MQSYLHVCDQNWARGSAQLNKVPCILDAQWIYNITILQVNSSVNVYQHWKLTQQASSVWFGSFYVRRPSEGI